MTTDNADLDAQEVWTWRYRIRERLVSFFILIGQFLLYELLFIEHSYEAFKAKARKILESFRNSKRPRGDRDASERPLDNGEGQANDD